MKESYLYEAEDIDDKVVGTREKEDGEKVKVTVKQAMDYSGEDKDMLALKDKAKDLKTKDKGGEEKPKAEPKKTAISKTGGLGGEPEDKPFGGDTGTDADFQREPSVEKSVSRKGVDKVISGTKAFSDKDTQETFDNIVNDENQRGRDIIDYGNMKAPLSVRQHDNLVNGKRTAHLVKSSDPADKLKLLKIVSNVVKKNEKPKEKRPGGKQAEDDYHKADMMMKKYAGRDIPKAEFWAKKKKQAADAMMGRTGKELGETKMMKLETLLKENPAAIAAVQTMTAIKLQGKGNRKIQATTALKDKDHPSHKKAVGLFQKLKDKFSKKKEDEPEFKDYTPTQSDTDFYRKQYAARTGKELGETKMNESVKFHTITGNKRFMTKTALPILRKYGAKNVKVNLVGGDYLEVRFPIDSRKLKKLDKELKRKNKTAYGGIVENRRDKMREDILRKIIREEIRKIIVMEEDDKSAFDAPIPAQVNRFMKRFIDAVQGARLNRRRIGAILGRVVVALQIEPNELMRYVRLVKKGL